MFSILKKINGKFQARKDDSLIKSNIEGVKKKNLKNPKLLINSASLSFTENCNAKCITCDHWKSSKKREEHLAFEEWRGVIEQLVAIGVKRIFLTGGEPLLYKNTLDLIKFSKKAGVVKVEMQTNGLLLKKYLDQIPESGIDVVNVSIDGVGDFNDNLRGVRGYFKNALEYLPKLRVKNKNLTMTLLKENIDQVDKLKDLCQQHGFGLNFNLPDKNLYFDNKDNVNFPDPEQVARFLERVWYDEKHKRYIKSYLENGFDSNNVCILGLKKIYIGFNGEVYSGCYVLPTVGNIKNKSIEMIVKENEYRDRIIKMINHDCPGCSCGYRLNMKYCDLVG